MAVIERLKAFFSPDLREPIPSIRDIEAHRVLKQAKIDLSATLHDRYLSRTK